MNKLRIAGCLLAGSLSWVGLAADPAQPPADTERSAMSAKISALLRGKFHGFSSDRLFRFLNTLGNDVEIVVRETPKKKASSSTRVIVTV